MSMTRKQIRAKLVDEIDNPEIRRVAALAEARAAQGGRFNWHKWYAWHPVYISGQWFQGWTCFEWLWRCRSVDDTLWWHLRMQDWPKGVSHCATCGDGADNRLKYGTQPCLTEPDKAHFHCNMGYAKFSKNEYVRRQMSREPTW